MAVSGSITIRGNMAVSRRITIGCSMAVSGSTTISGIVTIRYRVAVANVSVSSTIGVTVSGIMIISKLAV